MKKNRQDQRPPKQKRRRKRPHPSPASGWHPMAQGYSNRTYARKLDPHDVDVARRKAADERQKFGAPRP